MIPSQGETPGAWWENTGSLKAQEAAARRGGSGTEFDLAVYFLHDVPPEVAASGEPHQRPEAAVVFGSVCQFTAWPAVPIRVVVGADDRFFPAEFQRALARTPALPSARARTRPWRAPLSIRGRARRP